MAHGILVNVDPRIDSPSISKGKTTEYIYGSYHPADPAKLKLESNFGPMRPNRIGFLQPTSKDTPIEVMRERYFKDGYQHVRICRYPQKGQMLTLCGTGERFTTESASPGVQTSLLRAHVTFRSAQAGH